MLSTQDRDFRLSEVASSVRLYTSSDVKAEEPWPDNFSSRLYGICESFESFTGKSADTDL